MYKHNKISSLDTIQDWYINEKNNRLIPYSPFSYKKLYNDKDISILLYQALHHILPNSIYYTIIEEDKYELFGININSMLSNNIFILGDSSTYCYISNFINGKQLTIPEYLYKYLYKYIKKDTLNNIKYNDLTTKAQEYLISCPVNGIWIQCNDLEEYQFVKNNF